MPATSRGFAPTRVTPFEASVDATTIESVIGRNASPACKGE